MVILVGLLGTLVFFQAQFLSGFDQFFGNRSDSRFILYLCEHWYRVFQGQAEWLSPGMFHPLPGILGRSDLALGLAIPYSLLRAVGLEPFLALEVTTILLTVLAYGLTVWLLVRVLGLRPLWGSLGAAFFTFNSAKLALSYHLQLQFVWPLPVIFGCAILADRSESRKRAFLWLCGAGLALDLLLMTSFYLGWFCLFWSGLWLLLSGRASRRLWLPALGALAVTAVGLAPLLWAYLPVLTTQGTFGLGEVVAPQWWSPLAMGDGNYLWGWLTRRLLPAPRPHGWEESLTGLGLVPTLAWLALTVWALRHRRRAIAATVLATTLVLVLNMQYGGHIPLSELTHRLPGGGAIRVPARWTVFLALPMGLALAWAGQRTRFALLLAALALVEQVGTAEGYSIRAERAYLNALIKRLPAGTTAFYVDAPWWDRHVDSDYQTDAMMVSALSGVPTLNGWTSRAVPNWYLQNFRERPYEALVKGWVGLHRVTGPVVRLELTPPVEAYSRTPMDLRAEPFFSHGQARLQHFLAQGRLPTWEEFQEADATRVPEDRRATAALAFYAYLRRPPRPAEYEALLGLDDAALVEHFLALPEYWQSQDFGLPPGFVRARGAHFEVDGRPYRFVGANLWYAMYLDPGRLRRELDRLHALGVENVRVLAATEGPALGRALQNSPDIYNEELLVGLDRLLDELSQRHMRAVLVLLNSQSWSGGMEQYVAWNGGSPPFYTNERALALYERLLKKVVGRRNSLNRVAYRDDPTIMAWELLADPPEAPGRAAWEERALRALRAQDNNHLVSRVDFGAFEQFRCPRDGGSCDPASPTTRRDHYFQQRLAQAVAGSFFWAWAGEGRPREPGGRWRPGDPFTGDPPDVPQGRDSVYDADVSTGRVIRSAAPPGVR